MSTIAQAEPDKPLLEVNVDCAWLAVTVPFVGDIVPFVALHATGISGNVPPAGKLLEFFVMSAVMVES